MCQGSRLGAQSICLVSQKAGGSATENRGVQWERRLPRPSAVGSGSVFIARAGGPL